MDGKREFGGDLGELKRDIALLRGEVSVLHREMLYALQCISVAMDELKSIRSLEKHAAERLDDLAGKSAVGPAGRRSGPDHCRVCGGPLDRHPASNGGLLVCSACGWSEFVALDGGESFEVRPDDVPRSGIGGDWAV